MTRVKCNIIVWQRLLLKAAFSKMFCHPSEKGVSCKKEECATLVGQTTFHQELGVLEGKQEVPEVGSCLLCKRIAKS